MAPLPEGADRDGAARNRAKRQRVLSVKVPVPDRPRSPMLIALPWTVIAPPWLTSMPVRPRPNGQVAANRQIAAATGQVARTPPSPSPSARSPLTVRPPPSSIVPVAVPWSPKVSANRRHARAVARDGPAMRSSRPGWLTRRMLTARVKSAAGVLCASVPSPAVTERCVVAAGGPG